MIGESIKHNLRNIGRFSGRDRQGQFWPYAIIVALAGGAMLALAILPEMFRSMRRMRQFAEANPKEATITTGPSGTSIRIEGHHPDLMPDMGSMMIGMGVVALIMVILMAASVTRRLHDTNRSGLWGLIPLVFLISGCFGTAHIFASPEPDMTVFLLLFLNNLVYLASLLLLIVLLLLSGTAGENRFGSPAARS